MKSIAVVLSAGTGNRFNNTLPKQYHILNGKRVVGYVIKALNKSKIDEIIVMCGNQEYCDMISSEYNVKTFIGGNTRNETIANALSYIRANYDDEAKVLFCDSARPNLKSEYVNECLDLLNENDCVITTQKITDSLGNINFDRLDRENFYLIQTPECFKLGALKNFDKNKECTAIMQQLDPECKIYKNFNCKNNIKIQKTFSWISQC